MKKLTTLIVIIVLAIIGYYAASPYYTAYQLKNAYDANDGDTLVTYIDFEQLQPNIKQQLDSRFEVTLGQYPLVAQLGGEPLAQAADEFINNAVSQALTADNISSLIATQGQANTATKELAAAWAIATNKVNLQHLIQDIIAQRGDIDAVVKNQVQQIMTEQSAELEQHVQSGEDSAKPSLNYCGINCFTISGQVKGYPLTLEMQRQGWVDWKIVNVVLP
ncbi:DUF2939 domain-containing protein [Psychrobacter sp. FDAARGOS_221]|uniref:DUF2939 domain-containing protein n=1 Tax=Psychrobacter sp. FDAARGOS_221 TaxID=1975705 RepID=UPI000BB55341|nr:DUF2939 domain-containing protein [Psychrobacter sp. FDAARGOS_221]PNK60818.1 DUF2939 domain-containing protein [Psychrobacter sp. FDAARGOS_221]